MTWKEIVAEVPSCEEWQASEKYNKHLEELLKECKQWFDWYHIDAGTGKEYIESWHKKVTKYIKKSMRR